MKIREVLEEIRQLKPSQIAEEMMIRWLSDLDMRIFEEVIVQRVPDADTPETFEPYTAESAETELLVKEPDAREVYRWWLEMQIDLANQEYDKYENSASLFNTALSTWRRKYARTHRQLENIQFYYG